MNFNSGFCQHGCMRTVCPVCTPKRNSAQIGRFVIRDFNPWDSSNLLAMTADPVLTKYMGFRTHTLESEAAELIRRYGEGPAKYQAVCPFYDLGDIFGVIGFEVQRHQATITIMFRGDWKARGAGREFSEPFVKWIFTHPEIWRVWSYCHVDNIPAQRVLERMGAVREGLLRRFEFFPNVSDEPQDCYIYAIVR